MVVGGGTEVERYLNCPERDFEELGFKVNRLGRWVLLLRAVFSLTILWRRIRPCFYLFLITLKSESTFFYLFSVVVLFFCIYSFWTFGL